MSAREDFDLVVAHYECPPDEVELMKGVAAKDRQLWVQMFADMAQRIRGQ